MSEGEKQQSLKAKPTRRDFLRMVAGLGGVIVANSLGIPGCSSNQKPPKPIDEQGSTRTLSSSSRELVPQASRFLTEEELGKARIRIIQTDKVTLKVEKEIFNFPLFGDAKEGKIKEAVIVLVDHPSMSWNASRKLPEDARLVWQAVTPHPSEHSEKYWEDKQKEAKEALEMSETWVKEDQEKIEKSTNPNLKNLDEKMLDRDKGLLNYFQEAENAFSQGKEIGIQAVEQWGRGYPSEVIGGQIIRLDTEYDYPQAPRIQRLFQEYPLTAKRFTILKKEHPELEGKVFIYIAVGGDFKPNPAQSSPYPNSRQFMELPKQSEDSLRYNTRRTAGLNLRHELGHYETDSPSAGEYGADTKMLESIKGGIYPFHFFTDGGETITQRQPLNQVT